MTLLKKIGISYPIIQAPMAGVSTPQMAAIVSNEGGLGSIGIGAADVATARQMIEAVRGLTDKPFNVNVFTHRPAQANSAKEAQWIDTLRPLFDPFGAQPPAILREIYKSFAVDNEMIEAVIELAPPVVSFHFGLPEMAVIQKLKAAGCVLLSTATNITEAREAAEAAIDAIVAQGYEAGGHRGVFDPNALDDRLNTEMLTRTLLKELGIPVIAAGGIMDGKAARKFLDMGAAAVQLGTAFVGCLESSADDFYRAALLGAKEGVTIMTRVISGRPARCLANKFALWGEGRPDNEVPDYPVAYDAGKALNAAAKAAGEGGYGAQWAGTGAHLSKSLPTAGLMRLLIKEMEDPASGLISPGASGPGPVA